MFSSLQHHSLYRPLCISHFLISSSFILTMPQCFNVHHLLSSFSSSFCSYLLIEVLRHSIS